jgi:chitinase
MIGRHTSRLIVKVFMLALMLALTLSASLVSAARDRTPPTAPTLSVTEVSSNYVSLRWTASIDNSPFIWYRISINGSPINGTTTANLSTTIRGLTPNTTYVFTVQARDNGINWSPSSNAVTVTTASVNGGDTTAPTTPANLSGFDGGCGEAYLSWTQSTDNVDPQFAIRYDVYVNNIFRPESSGYGLSRTVAYAAVEGLNTFKVIAVDSAGNASSPASINLQLFGLCQ